MELFHFMEWPNWIFKSTATWMLTVVGLLCPSVTSLATNDFIRIENGYFFDPGKRSVWLPHGVAYQTWNRPLGVWQTFDQLDYDLDEMVKLGANAIRADFVWQHIEEEGDNRFSWSNYDYLVQACERRGLRLFALIGYQWPPAWFPDEWYTMHPPAKDAEGIYHPKRWRSDIISYEHPKARAQYGEFFQAVCTRYKTSKAIAAWIIGNEYGYLGLWSGLQDGYDPACEDAFRRWCETKYATNIVKLNTIWMTSYTNFANIVLVEEYRQYGGRGAQWADMIQWREDSIASFTASGAQAARVGDPNHLLAYSTVGMQWGEEDWRYHSEDRGKIARACAAVGAPLDLFAVNNYPWAILGHESQNGHWGVSFTKKVAGVPVIYSETGFTSSEILWLGMDDYQQGDLIRNSLWEGLAAGAIGTHLFTWQDRPYITIREAGFGIVTADRRMKPAFWSVRDTFTAMEQVRLHELLRASQDPKPEIGFLWTDANDSQYNRYETEMQQIAGACERLGFEPGFLEITDLISGSYTNYKVIVLPRNMRAESEVPGTGKGVLAFLRTEAIPRGIHILAGADLPGRQDGNGRNLPDFRDEMTKLFGVDATNVQGYEVPPRVGSRTYDHWHPITVEFNTNAPGLLGSGFSYQPATWKFHDQLQLATGGVAWAQMDIQENRGFEDDSVSLSPWKSWGNALVCHNWGWQKYGTNMVQLTGESGLYSDFPAVPGGHYSWAAWLRSNADDPLRQGKRARVTIEWYGVANNLISHVGSDELVTSTDGHWVYSTVSGVAPEGVSYGRRVVRVDGPGEGSVFVDNPHRVPAVIAKDHQSAKAVLFAYAPGDMSPNGDRDSNDEMDVLPWKWRFEVFGSVLKDYFGLRPRVEGVGTNAYLCLAEFRSLQGDATLWQVKNYAHDRFRTNGGASQTFVLRSSLFEGRIIEALLGGGILSSNSSDQLTLTLPPNGMEMLYVHPAAMQGTNAPAEPVVRIIDFPASVHPFGDKAYAVRVRFDCGGHTNLQLRLAFMEQDDNGDGRTNEIYQTVTNVVSGFGEQLFYIWIPDPDLSDSDYLATKDGSHYEFRAWLERSSGQPLAESPPAPVRLEWGIRPVTGLPLVTKAGDWLSFEVEWENLPEQLWWQTTSMSRNEAFPARVAIFRSTKTERKFPGHLQRANRVADWLESLGYESANPSDLSFDNILVSENLFADTFSNGMAKWQREAGAGNWVGADGILHASRIGNDDNIVTAGNPTWSNYTVSVDFRYNKRDPYFSDVEVYLRYQDRWNFCKVGIQKFYGFWRIKYTIRVGGDNVRQGWLYEFPKDLQPSLTNWYTLRVVATNTTFLAYFDGQYVGSFHDDHFATGRIGLGSRAVQLGVWEPQRAYYLIDDDEFSYYSETGQTSTRGEPLNLSAGYLIGFYPTLVLPSVFVMSDIEVSNVVAWLGAGLNSLIVTDGGAAVEDELGAFAPQRLSGTLGASNAVARSSQVVRVQFTNMAHYVCQDLDTNSTVEVSGAGYFYSALAGGGAIGVARTATSSFPALVVNTPPNANSNAPSKTFTFNFPLESSDDWPPALHAVARRAFELARNQAYKVTVELKLRSSSGNPDQDLTLARGDTWITSSTGSGSVALEIPRYGVPDADDAYVVFYVHPWDAPVPWLEHRGFFSSGNDFGGQRIQVRRRSGEENGLIMYSDLGIVEGGKILTWPDTNVCRRSNWQAQYPDATAPERLNCFATTSTCSYVGWGVFKELDLSAFAEGNVSFWLRSTQPLRFELEDALGHKTGIGLDSTTGRWQRIAVPLSGFKSKLHFDRMYGLFLITANGAADFRVDDIEWNRQTAAPVTDSIRPRLAFTPSQSARLVGNRSLTIYGRASDNIAVTRVSYRREGDDPWLVAMGTSKWEAAVTLSPGTNAIVFVAEDAAGNVSLPLTRQVVFAPTSPLRVLIEGTGRIIPDRHGELLEIGKSYQLRAVPDREAIFLGWRGDVVGSEAMLNFQMRSNLTLRAVFTSNPFLRKTGSYLGLFSEPDRVRPESCGFLTISATGRGSFTGRGYLGGKPTSFSGEFDFAGKARLRFTNGLSQTILLHLTLGSSPEDGIHGHVYGGEWVSAFVGLPAWSNRKPRELVWKGKRTMLVDHDVMSSSMPMGVSYGTFFASPKGTVSWNLNLVDGNELSGATPLCEDGLWPLYASVDRGRSVVLGWIALSAPHDTEAPPYSQMHWVKPSDPASNHYPEGITNSGTVSVPSFAANYGPQGRILNATNCLLVLSDSSTGLAVTNHFSLGAQNRVRVLNGPAMLLRFNAAGEFSGNMLFNNEQRAFGGTLDQGASMGAGFFLTTNRSGRVTIKRDSALQ